MSYKPKNKIKSKGPNRPKTVESRPKITEKTVVESGNVFNFVNLQNSLNSGAAIQYVFHYADDQPVLQTEIISADMQRVINKLTIDRGWTTSVTPAIVTEYIEKSYEALAHFLDIYKSQNMSRLRDSKGRDLTPAFFKYENVSSPKLIGTFVTSPYIVVVDTGANAAITNYNWDALYVSHLSKLYLNSELIKLAVERYGAFHVSDDDTDYMAFYNFHMETDGVETIPQAWAATVAELDVLMSTHPDLSIILKALKFNNNVMTLSENSWQRVRTGDSMALLVNPSLKTDLINLHPNPQVAYPGYKDVDADRNRYIDFDGPYSVYGYPDSATMGVTPFKQRAISPSISPKGLCVTTLTSQGLPDHGFFPIMSNLRVQMVTVPQFIPTMPALGQFIRNWDTAVAANVEASTVPLWRTTTIGVDWDSTTTVTSVANSVSHSVIPNEGNVYQLDDINYILAITRANLLYGAFYKKDLFELYSSISEPNNVK